VFAVAGAAELVNEVHGFSYRLDRNITGFIDGVANRQVRRAAEVAIVPPGYPGAGGSHVLAMRWVRDLAGFNSGADDGAQTLCADRPPNDGALGEAGNLHPVLVAKA
jgi:deferrochelatase/peroxidase EfeB